MHDTGTATQQYDDSLLLGAVSCDWVSIFSSEFPCCSLDSILKSLEDAIYDVWIGSFLLFLMEELAGFPQRHLSARSIRQKINFIILWLLHLLLLHSHAPCSQMLLPRPLTSRRVHSSQQLHSTLVNITDISGERIADSFVDLKSAHTIVRYNTPSYEIGSQICKRAYTHHRPQCKLKFYLDGVFIIKLVDSTLGSREIYALNSFTPMVAP